MIKLVIVVGLLLFCTCENVRKSFLINHIGSYLVLSLADRAYTANESVAECEKYGKKLISIQDLTEFLHVNETMSQLLFFKTFYIMSHNCSFLEGRFEGKEIDGLVIRSTNHHKLIFNIVCVNFTKKENPYYEEEFNTARSKLHVLCVIMMVSSAFLLLFNILICMVVTDNYKKIPSYV
jgi:hypothetical protein